MKTTKRNLYKRRKRGPVVSKKVWSYNDARNRGSKERP